MEDDALLWEEVDAVDNYIYILNVRFAGDINYEKMWMRESEFQDSKYDFAASGGKCSAAWNPRLYGNWKNQNVYSQDGDDLEITVSDNGAGMTQEMIRSVMAGHEIMERTVILQV